jgi:hypothetical protein
MSTPAAPAAPVVIDRIDHLVLTVADIDQRGEVIKPASTDLTEGAVLNRLHIDPQLLAIPLPDAEDAGSPIGATRPPTFIPPGQWPCWSGGRW